MNSFIHSSWCRWWFKFPGFKMTNCNQTKYLRVRKQHKSCMYFSYSFRIMLLFWVSSWQDMSSSTWCLSGETSGMWSARPAHTAWGRGDSHRNIRYKWSYNDITTAFCTPLYYNMVSPTVFCERHLALRQLLCRVQLGRAWTLNVNRLPSSKPEMADSCQAVGDKWRNLNEAVMFLPDEIKMTSISQCYLTDIAMTRLYWVSSARDTHCVFYKALHYTLHRQERPIENQTGYWLICNNKTIHITMQNIIGQESEVSNSRPRRWQWREQCAESCLKRKSCVWAAFL